MNIVTKIADWQTHRQTIGQKRVGFVPTMGHLHEGHLSLCERAQAENDIIVVSIFVNPTQFNQTQDYERYTRCVEADLQLLAAQKIDAVIMPVAEDMYQDAYQVQVEETEISRILEGEYRPGHFKGMLTVVLKLLNLVRPDQAYFGEKDYQQLLLIKKMVQALFLSITIHACPTIRAADGLALSSRNARLNAKQRELAAYFPQLLRSNLALDEIKMQLMHYGFKVDYLAEKWERRLGAVWLDEVRLIDNIAMDEIRSQREPLR